MFGREKPAAHVVERTLKTESDAPFQLQFAPGVMVVDAEIRDRESLQVFVSALQALGALLPERQPAPLVLKTFDEIKADLAARGPSATEPVDVTPLPDVSKPPLDEREPPP